MGKTSRYVSNKDYDEIERLLYNGIPIDNYWDQYYSEETRDEDWINYKLKLIPFEKDEKYAFYDPWFVFTSYGRMWTLNRDKWMKVTFTKKNLFWPTSTRGYKPQEIFEENDWEYDVPKLLQRFVDGDPNNWVWSHGYYQHNDKEVMNWLLRDIKLPKKGKPFNYTHYKNH